MIRKFLLSNRFIRKSAVSMYDEYWKLIMQLFRFLPKSLGEEITNDIFSIAIVTYVERFESYFKPLIINLTILFPDTQIVVGLNGFHDLEKQRNYLKDARLFLSKYKNITIIDFEEAQSLSKLWNLVIFNSVANKTLVLNDDLRISPWFRKELEKTGIIETEISLINRSWSHYLISKDIIKKVGWFDQRFPAMGNEDEDYECRMVLKGVQKKVFEMKYVQNVVAIPETYSFGEHIDLINTKYPKANKIFFDSKWQLSETHENGFQYIEMLKAYVKQRPGMETPNFYENENFIKNNSKIK